MILSSDQFWEVLRAGIKSCYSESLAYADLDLELDENGQLVALVIEGGSMKCEGCGENTQEANLALVADTVKCIGCRGQPN